MSATPRPRSTTTRRRRPGLVAAGLVVVGGLVLAACGSPPSTGGDDAGREPGTADGGVSAEDCNVAALDEASGPVNVQMWFGGLVDPPVTVLESMVDDFNASQDQVVLAADNQGVAYDEVLRKYQGASATPDQLPDIIYLEDTALGEMVDKGQVLPAEACMLADDYDIDQITAAARGAFVVDDVLYPGYMNVSTPVLYYNKVHFQKAGLDPNDPPTTLAEIQEVSEVLKEKGVSTRPFSFKADQWFFSTWLAGVGQDLVNNDNGRSEPATEATFDAEPTLEALGLLDEMNDAGLLNPFPVTDGSIDHYLALATEDSSMLVETSTASGTIAAALGGELTPEDAGIELDAEALDATKIVPASGQYPGIEAPGQIYASGGAFYLLNTGEDAEIAAAWEFLKFMLQPENAIRWHIEGGYLPVIKEIVNDPAITEFQETGLDGQMLKAAVTQLAAADPDRAGPLIGPMVAFEDIMQGALESVLFNGTDVAGTITDAQAEATELLQDYNGD